jgi:thymidylate synthase
MLNVVNIEARDLQEAWWLSLRKIFSDGYEYIIDKGSYEGSRRKEMDFVTIQIWNPAMRPLVPDVPEGIPAPTSIEYVEQQYLPYLLTSTKENEKEQYTYGEDLESQIPKVIEMYRKGGFNCNQAYMAVGDKNSINLSDPQCLRGIDTRIRYGALHFMVYFRSWDLWAGFPSNLAGIQLMKEMMANELGVEDGELIACSKGLHLYDYAWDWAKACGRLE